MHLCVQTVAASPFGRLAFRDNCPCRLVVAGEARYLYVVAAVEASVKRSLAMMTHLNDGTRQYIRDSPTQMCVGRADGLPRTYSKGRTAATDSFLT
jgi:hypothetical protein